MIWNSCVCPSSSCFCIYRTYCPVFSYLFLYSHLLFKRIAYFLVYFSPASLKTAVFCIFIFVLFFSAPAILLAFLALKGILSLFLLQIWILISCCPFPWKFEHLSACLLASHLPSKTFCQWPDYNCCILLYQQASKISTSSSFKHEPKHADS